jgi:hypothetical protein
MICELQIDTRASWPKKNEIESQGKGGNARRDDDDAMINVPQIYEVRSEK